MWQYGKESESYRTEEFVQVLQIPNGALKIVNAMN
jgi:hypothetical protein